MGQELGLDGQPGVFPLSDRFAEMGGIPVNDDGGEQVEPGHAVVLAFAGAVADFALASDLERVLERVMSLALVQAGVGSALHIGVEQSVDDEERSFDPSDFAESDGQFLLARIGRELSQQLARRKGAAGQGGSNPQDVRRGVRQQFGHLGKGLPELFHHSVQLAVDLGGRQLLVDGAHHARRSWVATPGWARLGTRVSRLAMK